MADRKHAAFCLRWRFLCSPCRGRDYVAGKTLRTAIILWAALLGLVGCASMTQFQSLKTRAGVHQGFLLMMPQKEKPIASIILFAGGHGNLKLFGTNIGWGRNNFLVRTRDQFVKQVILGTPFRFAVLSRHKRGAYIT